MKKIDLDTLARVTGGAASTQWNQSSWNNQWSSKPASGGTWNSGSWSNNTWTK
jgi:hypothetical protein